MADLRKYDEPDDIQDALDSEDGDEFLVEIIQEEGWDEARKYLSETLLERIAEIEGKRSKIVIDHIQENGWISTKELQDDYGYDHAPRAARDVREQGVPLNTFYPSEYDDRVGAYRLNPNTEALKDYSSGRSNIPDSFKEDLVDEYGEECNICQQDFEGQFLQVDHRVPYRVAGEAPGERRVEDYMLVCQSCNRKKSWQCEHCENGNDIQSRDICQDCYWASPEGYDHVAMRTERRVEVVWSGDDVESYEELEELADENGVSVPQLIRNRLVESAE